LSHTRPKSEILAKAKKHLANAGDGTKPTVKSIKEQGLIDNAINYLLANKLEEVKEIIPHLKTIL